VKIGYLLDDTLDKPDGVQQYVLAVSEYMRSKGHEVHYLVAETTRGDLPNIHSLGKFVSLKFNGNTVRTPRPASKKAIRSLMDELDLDVLHVQLGFSPFFGAHIINNVSERCNVVGTWHTFPSGPLHTLSNWLLGKLISNPLARVHTMVSVSPATQGFVKKVFGRDSEVVANAVDISKFAVHGHKAASKVRILFLGRFVKRKGPLYLTEALGKLRRNNLLPSNVEVILAGKGPDLEKCKIRASQLNLDKFVSFPGFVDEADKPALLASADITIFPSTGGEAFGISVVEAMASGASVVLGGNNPGYASILGGRPELLFDSKDTSLFAQIILRTINMPTPEAQEIKSWLKKQSSKYNTPTICATLLKLYLHKQQYLLCLNNEK
jgi:phosphatidyl-myo-inositol alpha-mannosyltransferase